MFVTDSAGTGTCRKKWRNTNSTAFDFAQFLLLSMLLLFLLLLVLFHLEMDLSLLKKCSHALYPLLSHYMKKGSAFIYTDRGWFLSVISFLLVILETLSNSLCRLTSFVLRVFHEARPYVYVDDGVLQRAIDWITSRQNQDGSFNEFGRIFDSEMRVSDRKNHSFLSSSDELEWLS